ncbi:hypothetical protein VQH23_04755 [Pararoseomonas sp. SCSIO 73927]|uniref:hypothetical protein n=1 Tax=Pararoseomonas sp. SCSIO 73927 TaxID=3114537 RepID=UPI0030D20240
MAGNTGRLAAALLMGAAAMATGTVAEAASFDRSAWEAGRGNDTGRNPRAGQVAALRESGAVRPGTPRDAVRALLGAPENVSESAEGARELYSLGIGFGGSLEYFAVQYDEGGKVTRASLVRG